jgi:hypothetical protein
MAKAHKHVRLTRGDPKVSAASDVSSRTIGFGQLPYGRGRFGGVAQVVVELGSGRGDYVESLVKEAIFFLEGVMKDAAVR